MKGMEFIMSQRVKLQSTNNPKMMSFEGEYGTLTPNSKGGWNFEMEKGGIISTSEIAPNTTLGDLNHPSCKEFSFTTKSGSTYIFDICNRERLIDGCQRNDNQFQSYNDNTQEWEFTKE